VLRLLGVAALWIYLLSRPSVFTLIVLGAMLVVIVAGVRVLFDPVMDQVGLLSGRVVDAFVMMLNPPLVLVNILAQTLYALVGQDEDLLADLRAVEFTRHPDALHAALRRVRAAAPSGPPLPLAYHMRYFTAEGVLPVGFPAAQPPVEQRLRVLERVDPSLAATRVLRPRILECPDCGEPLAGRSVASHYGAPIPIDACEACGGIWFDDLELYMTGSQELLAGRAGTPARPAPGGPRRCPRCRVALERASTFGIPDEIAIWECGVCRGAWVGPDDLVRFGRFRDARRRSATASTRRAD
jgi:Zn-finger nucleic acid-binding protein